MSLHKLTGHAVKETSNKQPKPPHASSLAGSSQSSACHQSTLGNTSAIEFSHTNHHKGKQTKLINTTRLLSYRLAQRNGNIQKPSPLRLTTTANYLDLCVGCFGASPSPLLSVLQFQSPALQQARHCHLPAIHGGIESNVQVVPLY